MKSVVGSSGDRPIKHECGYVGLCQPPHLGGACISSAWAHIPGESSICLVEFEINENRGESEVSFTDIQDGTAHLKKGFEKVKKYCELTAQTYGYVWIDTCCIRIIARATMLYESGGCCRRKWWVLKFWTSKSLLKLTCRTSAYLAPSFLSKLLTLIC
jgi:hypothetical protein